MRRRTIRRMKKKMYKRRFVVLSAGERTWRKRQQSWSRNKERKKRVKVYIIEVLEG